MFETCEIRAGARLRRLAYTTDYRKYASAILNARADST
jgi:hypothetical protein